MLKQQLRYWAPHFPLSVAGVLIISAALLALRGFGYARMDLVIFALTVCALAIVLTSLLAVTMTGIWLRRRMRQAVSQPLSAINAEAGYPNETGFCLPSYAWLPLMKLDWQVVAPDTMTTTQLINPDDETLEESVTPQQRCRGSEVTRLFTVSDVLGLCRFSWRLPQPASIQVLPRTGRLRNLPVLRSMDNEDGIPNPRGNPDGDRMDIRRYAPGDSTRNILWRVYARSRHLNVRLPEKSMFQSDRTLAYQISGQGDEAAAGVARFAITQGLLGSPWVFGADGSTEAAVSVSTALTLIAGSRQPGKVLEFGLDAFLARHGGTQSACIVFAPASADTWTAALLSTINRYPGAFTVVLATDDLSDVTPSPRWQKLFLREDSRHTDNSTNMAELRTLVAGLVKAGAQVWIVDRQSGHTFDHRLKRV